MSNNRRLFSYPSVALLLLLIVLAVAALYFGFWRKPSSHHHGQTPPSGQLHSQSTSVSTPTVEKVDVFGGSMAYGWKDPDNDSYLQRAFTARSKQTKIYYTYINHTAIGQTAYLLDKKHPGQFAQWLRVDKPQVVVLSWGLLDDMSSRNKIPVDTFANAVKGEIAQALATKAVVLIVTPPVTEESATNDHSKQEIYIDKLFSVAQSFHNRNVIDIDVYHQMENYMQAHGQTYRDYMGNSWHPNRAGHELAGQLLADDLNKRFGNGPILYQTS